MKILETIDLRVSAAYKGRTIEMIQLLIDDINKSDEVRIHYYHNYNIKTDYTIQIFHNKNSIEETGSRIAQRIMFNLKGFGLIHHTIWRKL